MRRVGIIGGGQLGLMLCESLGKLGAHIRVYDPQPNAPARRACHDFECAPFSDLASLTRFVQECDVVTYEFESIDLNALEEASLAKGVHVVPATAVLATTRSRVAEREFIERLGLPCAPFRVAHNSKELKTALDKLGLPLVVKTDRGGYDGKGQWVVRHDDEKKKCEEEASAFFQANPADQKQSLLVERRLELTAELSCIVARRKKQSVCFPIFENEHEQQILALTRLPATLPKQVQNEALAIAQKCAEGFDLEGLLTVEFFFGRLSPEGPEQLLINEFAPRPHNSGHVTRCATNLSQFDALARCLLDLPLPNLHLLPREPDQHFEMINALGKDWEAAGGRNAWREQHCRAANVLEVYDYGKEESRPLRKMGHVLRVMDRNTSS